MNGVKNRRFIETSIHSGDSSWNSDNQSFLRTVKTKKYEKLSKEKKLENIFKIYNRKDMVTKLNSLRKNNQNEKLRTSHFKSTEIGDDSYHDNDYSSVYLTKLENNHKRMNTSLYSTRPRPRAFIPEMPEAEASLEATPNNSTKLIGKEYQKSSEKKLRLSYENFNGQSMRNNSEDKKVKSKRKSKNAMKFKKLNTIVQNFVPLRQQQMIASDVDKNYSNRYSNADEIHT